MGKKSSLKRAIHAVGGISAVARKLNLQRQAVQQWKRCPPHHVLKLEKISGVPRETLRPDLYPKSK